MTPNHAVSRTQHPSVESAQHLRRATGTSAVTASSHPKQDQLRLFSRCEISCRGASPALVPDWSPPQVNGGYSHHLSSRTLSPSSRPAQESSSVFADETCSNVSCLLDSERFPGRGGRTVLARAIAGLRDHALIARDGNIFCQMPKKRQRVGGGDVDQKKLTGWLCAGRAFLGPWCEK